MTKLKTAALLLALPFLFVSCAKSQSQISGGNFIACIGEGIGPDGTVTSFFELNLKGGKRMYRVPFADRKAAQAFFDDFKKSYLDEEKTGEGMGGRIAMSYVERFDLQTVGGQEYISVDLDAEPNFAMPGETVSADYLIDRFGQIVGDFLQVGTELMSCDLTTAQEERVLEIIDDFNLFEAFDSF